jgi:hypothetical protein
MHFGGINMEKGTNVFQYARDLREMANEGYVPFANLEVDSIWTNSCGEHLDVRMDTETGRYIVVDLPPLRARVFTPDNLGDQIKAWFATWLHLEEEWPYQDLFKQVKLLRLNPEVGNHCFHWEQKYDYSAEKGHRRINTQYGVFISQVMHAQRLDHLLARLEVQQRVTIETRHALHAPRQQNCGSGSMARGRILC